MATHDYVIDNQSAPSFRSDLNNVLQAIVTQNSSATAPTTTYADMIWYDTANNQLKKRNEANSAWIVLGTIDEGLGTFTPSGQPIIASQAEAEAGTENTKMMTALRSAQAIAALGGIAGINVQRFATSGTYTRTTGYRFALCIVVGGGGGGGGSTSSQNGGTGGAGAVVVGAINLSGLTAQTVTVGAGGAAGTTIGPTGGTGGTSSIGTLITAAGGGGGQTNAIGASGTTGTGGVVIASPNGQLGNGSGPSAAFMPHRTFFSTGIAPAQGQGGAGRTSDGAQRDGHSPGGPGYVIIVEFR